MKMFKLNTQQKYFSTLLFSVLFIGACSPSQPNSPIFKSDLLDGLYSTRSNIKSPEIFIAKLSTPALLETANRQNGKTIIDEKQAAAIKAEQEATIAELQKISKDIRILIRYRLVLNGLVVYAPADTLEAIKKIPNVVMSEKAGQFARLQDDDVEASPTGMVGPKTSVKFIGSEAAYAQNIRGQGMRIGVIDTGIDYTHKMFGGEGTVDAYKAVNPSAPTPAFPNKKVVGGIDLVGSNWSPSSSNPKIRIPLPDENPMDEATHGTHVAGSVAGIGDGVNTYDGVAPDALLYAIKVFGKGGTSDEVVIAALEYAADPTGDLSFSQQLDVVNLSLGSSYGTPHIMYNAAIKNLVRGGTVVVASAGNSGDQAYIVGAPSVSDDAISVASSIDDMSQNVSFPGAEFEANGTKLLAEIKEAQNTPSPTLENGKGELIFAGVADKDYSAEEAEKIKGKMALIDRGVVSFGDKIKRAQAAGAIGVIVANNAPGDAITMANETAAQIPAVMIDQEAGNKIKAVLSGGQSVTVNLKSESKIEKPWLADTISPFSSRGPRSEDGLIKPEISGPGTNIISAARGAGDKGVLMSGTSMSGPHVAGVMGLLKQKFPELSVPELKSVLLGHGKVINDEKKNIYSVSRQGAGRVQVDKSIEAKVVSSPSTLSLGLVDIENQKLMTMDVTFKNISKDAIRLSAKWSGSKALQFRVPEVTIPAGESKKVIVRIQVDSSLMKSANEELDGFLSFTQGEEILLQMPALAVTRKISRIEATSLAVASSSKADAPGSLAVLKIANKGINEGKAYIFNSLGKDDRKKDPKPDMAHSRNCDLQSSGYRVITGEDGKRYMQVALKLYEGLTTWHRCEVNVQIDSNDDGIADQELAGLVGTDLPGLAVEKFVSLLLDGNKARAIRKQYETDALSGKKVVEDYRAAVINVLPMTVFDNSTLAIITADVNDLVVASTGELKIKVSTTHNDYGAIEYDDYLGSANSWKKVSLSELGQAYTGMPDAITLPGHGESAVRLTKGYSNADLILYSPQNMSVRDVVAEDTQSQIVKPAFIKK
ncbi:S8 family serine peptidase [Bdellovibrio sp. HCB209]|uniref:S8 family serine peptidase n=1 Tax=Bdellovibrio sp. HCB209 TaxID=3394354 RepID=UPI0039B5ACCF